MEPLAKSFDPAILRKTGLTIRDAEILRYMIENRFVTIRAVEDRFWHGRGNRNQYRRIKKLIANRYVEVLHGDGGARLGYRARRRAVNALKSLGMEPAHLTDLGAVYRSGFDHDRTALDLRNILESSELVTAFQPEHIVREQLAKRYGYRDSEGNGYKVPDGFFRLRTAKGSFRVALELEIAVKTKARYRKALKLLSLSADWDVVFFVVSEKSRIGLLQGILADLRANDIDLKMSGRRNAIYFALLEEFQERKHGGTFEGERKSFSLASLADEVNATA